MPSKTDINDDNARASRIEDMLMYLGLYTKGFGCPDPMFFDDAIPAYGAMFRQIVANAGRNSRDIDARAASVPRLEGVAMYTREAGPGYTLIGCHPMSYQSRQRLFFSGNGLFRSPFDPGLDARALMTPLTPILQVRKVEIDDAGQGIATFPAYLIRPTALKNKWVELVSGPMLGDMTLAYVGFCTSVGIAMTMATDWAVSLKFDPASPGLRFVTDPTGVRDFFRFRDLPEGKARRAALANWVTDHWRILRHNPEDEVYVREHLRGNREFSWHGLTGSIRIPDADLKKEEAIKDRRKRMSPAEAIRRRRAGR